MMTDEELVDKIKSGDFDRKQLENLYANALERDRDSIAEAAKAALQEVDPRSYKRKYIKPIKDKVAQIARILLLLRVGVTGKTMRLVMASSLPEP